MTVVGTVYVVGSVGIGGLDGTLAGGGAFATDASAVIVALSNGDDDAHDADEGGIA